MYGSKDMGGSEEELVYSRVGNRMEKYTAIV